MDDSIFSTMEMLIRVALTLRPSPIFGFLQKARTASSVRLSGEHRNVCALRGELHNRFGAPARLKMLMLPESGLAVDAIPSRFAKG
jgi:hypothetical protein